MAVKTFLKRNIRRMMNLFAPMTVANITELAPNEVLRGRFALVTGGTSGIGFAIAEAFLKAGASVAITSRRAMSATEAVTKLRQVCGVDECRILGFEMDNSKVTQLHENLRRITQALGKIDILVNNAGVLGADSEEQCYDIVLDTNLKGVFYLSREVARYMKDNNIRGNILNIASSSSLRPATSAYALSKWGVRGLTLGLAKSLAPYGIVVNGIAPGPTATPMLLGDDTDNIARSRIPSGRFAMPCEIANMAVVLVSDMGRTIVGDIVYMTGGAGVVTLDDVDYSF